MEAIRGGEEEREGEERGGGEMWRNVEKCGEREGAAAEGAAEGAEEGAEEGAAE